MDEEKVELPPMDDLAKAEFKFARLCDACIEGRAVMIAMRHKDTGQRSFVACVVDLIAPGGVVMGEIRPVGFIMPEDEIYQSYTAPDVQAIVNQLLATRKAQAELMAAEQGGLPDLSKLRHLGTVRETVNLDEQVDPTEDHFDKDG